MSIKEQDVKKLVQSAPGPDRIRKVDYKTTAGKNCRIEYGRSNDDAIIHVFGKHGTAKYNKGETKMLIQRISKFVPRRISVKVLPPKGVMAPMYSFILSDFYTIPSDVDRQVEKIVRDLKENL